MLTDAFLQIDGRDCTVITVIFRFHSLNLAIYNIIIIIIQSKRFNN